MLYIVPQQPGTGAQMLRRLARLEEQIINVDAHITRQLLIVAQLERAGFPARSARGILAGFDKIREESIAERDRIRALLDQVTG
jgi:hypothetical protein